MTDRLAPPPAIYPAAPGLAAIVRGGMLVALLLGGGTPACGEPMGELSPVAGIVVRGAETCDAERLGRALAADDDLLLLSRPLGNRKLFLTNLARKATLALEREGLAAPRVKAVIEPTGEGTGERIVVEVVEGERLAAGEIDIRGFPDDLAAGLRRWLQGQRPPPGAVAIAVEAGDGWGGDRWVDEEGLPARMEPPLWERGKPAPFDAPRLQEVRAAVARFLREHGYHSAARHLQERRPHGLLGGLTGLVTGAHADAPSPSGSLEVAVRPDAGAGTARLVIAGHDLDPRSVLREVSLPATLRTDRDTLLAGLGIVPGAPVTELDRDAWRRRLHASGRFVKADVTFEERPAGPDGIPGIVARFELDEYSPATAYGDEPSREEAVMLRFARWLSDSLAGDDDLVVSWSRGVPAGEPAPVGQPDGAIVLSRARGVLVAAFPGRDDACGLSAGRDGLSWFFPAGAGRFEVPLPAEGRLTARVSLGLSRKRDAAGKETDACQRDLTVGAGFDSHRPASGGAFGVAFRVDPVACLALLHEGRPTTTWEGDTLSIASDGWLARFDGPSGRLVDLAVGDARLTIVPAANRFESDIAALRGSAGADRADPEALVTSGVGFFTDDSAAAAFQRAFRAAGIDSLAGTLRDRYGPLAAALRRAAESGALRGLDRAAAAALDSGDGPAPWPVPGEKPKAGDPLRLVGRIASARAWRVVERDCGRDTWPASLVRLATLGLAQDPAALEELSAFMTSDTAGPIAFLTAASAVPMPPLAITLARRGQDRLSAEAFRADARPLLALVSARGVDRAAVGIARSLDDADVATLGRLVGGDEGLLVPLVASLRAAPNDAAALEALPSALDVWWDEALSRRVGAALADIVSPRTAAKPSAEPPVR